MSKEYIGIVDKPCSGGAYAFMRENIVMADDGSPHDLDLSGVDGRGNPAAVYVHHSKIGRPIEKGMELVFEIDETNKKGLSATNVTVRSHGVTDMNEAPVQPAKRAARIVVSAEEAKPGDAILDLSAVKAEDPYYDRGAEAVLEGTEAVLRSTTASKATSSPPETAWSVVIVPMIVGIVELIKMLGVIAFDLTLWACGKVKKLVTAQ
ncbi:hypothetical protein FJY93_03735 [Candidatus Kaiserbacteria bacterium]|nr:hypothetical protein [Candidatus Kaiserbacteria bacterium]